MVTAVPIAQPAPWESVPPQDQLFVLITGANSGIGLGIAQRLINEFLATRSLTSHLILIPTTRSQTKSRETIRILRAYAKAAAQDPTTNLRSRAGGEDVYRWQDTVERIHILSLSLDLCDLRGMYAFADALCRGTVSNPDGLEGEYLKNVRVPRLDSVVYNAAFGGWSGVNWGGAIWSILSRGIIETATRPNFKDVLPTGILNERSSFNYPDKPLLAEVFTACTFGHYCLSHKLAPLLSRQRDSGLAPGRIIWSSSLEAHSAAFSVDDIQCLNQSVEYESSKRLTDILSLTCTLPSVQPYKASLLGTRATPRSLHSDSETDVEDDSNSSSATAEQQALVAIPPRMYLTHPGIVASTLFPLPSWLFWLYQAAVLLCRWLGSPWHTLTPYCGAYAPAWIALQEQETLDELDAERIKWGSGCDRRGNEFVKPTEVDDWGWRGNAEDPANDMTTGLLNTRHGRKAGAKTATKADVLEFEDLGVACWQEMERMRLQWDNILANE